jgi:ATP-dependent Zn protease
VERKSIVIPEKDRRNTAYHEGGHALIAYFSERTSVEGEEEFERVRGESSRETERHAEENGSSLSACVCWCFAVFTLCLRVHLSSTDTEPIRKATILPRGPALGFVAQVAEEDKYSMTRHQMMDRLAVCMGGRAAEEMIFGKDEVGQTPGHHLSSTESAAVGCSRAFGLTVYSSCLAVSISR